MTLKTLLIRGSTVTEKISKVYKPTFEQMARNFRKAKFVAYICGATCIKLFAIIFPGIMTMFPKMDLTQFSFWIWGTQIFAVIMALIVVIAPVSEEVYKIMKEYRKTSDKINGGYGNLETIAMDKVQTNDKTPITNV